MYALNSLLPFTFPMPLEKPTIPRHVMVQGTTSDAGKSTLVSALCRIFKRQNISVCPFKPQNMALNSAVTSDGGEIGRAQAVQALAAGVEPHTDMNPVLLKPDSDTGAQIIIQGKALSRMEAQAYHDYKPRAKQAVLESFERLTNQYRCVVTEGAGSPAEINLRKGDIANMGFAEAVDTPVILIADIDRGGVFAHLVGTLELLSQSEQERIIGFVINRFRGDIALLQNGLDWLEERTGKPVFAVLPYLRDLHLEAEDALTSNSPADTEAKDTLRIRVPVVSRISNHTDFDPLRLHPQVDFSFVYPGQALDGADLIVLPGTKNVIDDLAFLRANHWDHDVLKHLRYGGKVIGVCGGFQMLGKRIYDPLGIESTTTSSDGLALLDMETELKPQKTLTRRQGRLANRDEQIHGYEIHAGISSGAALNRPVMALEGHPEGAISEDGNIIGTYLHGLFEDPEALDYFLRWAGLTEVEDINYEELRESAIDRLADSVEKHMDWDKWDSAIKRFECS